MIVVRISGEVPRIEHGNLRVMWPVETGGFSQQLRSTTASFGNKIASSKGLELKDVTSTAGAFIPAGCAPDC